MIDWMLEIFFSEKRKGIIVFDLCSFSLVNEVRRDVATVKFHSLNDVHLIPQSFAVLDSDYSFLANLPHGFTDQVSDRGVTIGRDCGNLSNFFRSGNSLADCFELFTNGLDSCEESSPNLHRVGSMSNIVHPSLCNGSGKNCGCSSTISSLLISLVSNILDKLSSDVLELVLKFDLEFESIEDVIYAQKIMNNIHLYD